MFGASPTWNTINTSGDGTLLVGDGAHPAGDDVRSAGDGASMWPETAPLDGALPSGDGAHTASDGALDGRDGANQVTAQIKLVTVPIHYPVCDGVSSQKRCLVSWWRYSSWWQHPLAVSNGNPLASDGTPPSHCQRTMHQHFTFYICRLQRYFDVRLQCFPS